MGYRSPTGSSKSVGRGRQTSRREKKKTKGKKHHSHGKYLLEADYVPTVEETVTKTLSRLRSLGNQVFAVFPFSAYFDDWLASLKDVLVAFESSSSVTIDEQFVKERAQILADIEHKLRENRRKEVSVEEAIRGLSDSRSFLARLEKEYAAAGAGVEGRENGEIGRLRSSIEVLRRELDDLAAVKAGFFRAMSKKAKSQKEAELTQRLNAAQSELELLMRNSAAEQERLRREYEQKKQLINEQMTALQKEVESSEVDGSLADRRVACEALASSVSALLNRKTV